MAQIQSSENASRPLSAVTPQAWKVIPFFRSQSIQATIEFYTKTLSFKLGGTHPDPPAIPSFASLHCGPKAAVNIYFLRELDGSPPPAGRAMVAMEKLSDIATLSDELKEKGISVRKDEAETANGVGRCIMAPMEDMPWGYRQLELWDPDGNRLVFFAFLED